MDVFSTEYLAGVVQDLKTPAHWALDQFFGTQVTFETEAVDVDVISRKRRIAPLVSPFSPGRIMNQVGRETRQLKPAYVKDLRVFRAEQGLKRAVGEAIGGTMAPQQRIQMAIVSELEDQLNLLTRRQEIMAIEQLRTGHVTLVGADYPLTDIDLRRDATLTVDLTVGGAESTSWDQAGAHPLTDLKRWALRSKKLSGVYPKKVCMNTDVFSNFVNNADVVKRWQAQNAQLINIALKTDDANDDTGTYMGQIEGFLIYTYADWYVNDADEEVEILPSGELFMADANVEGVRNYGAILDLDSLQAVPFFAKSYTTDNPSARYLLLQSAPLPAMRRPNASVGVKVQPAAA